MHKLVEKRPSSSSRLKSMKQMWHRVAAEFGETAKLAWPMALTQIGQVVMMTIDIALIGHIGAEAVAAAALAGRIYILAFTFASGLLAPMVTLAAQGFEAKKLAVVRRALRMALWAAMMLSFPIMAIALCGERILPAFGQPTRYGAACPDISFRIGVGRDAGAGLSGSPRFHGAVNRPEPIFWITLAAIPVNALLAYLLIYGKIGLPRLGLFGAGLATTLVNCATFSAGLWFATMHRPFRDFHVLAHILHFDWPMLRQLLAIGAPMSMSLMGAGAFSAAALMASQISTSALAAHQIALQVTIVLSMIPLAISMAAAVRVGHAVGRNDHSGVQRAGQTAILLGMIIAAMLTLAVTAARSEIVELFLNESASDADGTIRLAAKLLLVGASFISTDAAQFIAAGSLRGLKDTWVPLLFVGIAYWLIGFSLGYLLGLKMGLGIVGIWIACRSERPSARGSSCCVSE